MLRNDRGPDLFSLFQPTITKRIVENCPALVPVLKDRLGKIQKYKYHVLKNSESHHVTFKMLNSNISDVVSHLDEIRQQTKQVGFVTEILDNNGAFLFAGSLSV